MKREIKMLQPSIILVDPHLRLRAIEKKDYALALPWYQDREILKGTGSPDREQGYDLSTVVKLYEYLSKIGECYIIEVSESSAWVSIGDVTLSENTMPIVIGDKRYWGQGIGKRAILALLQRAKQLGYQKISLNEIYFDNQRSLRLFKSCGFDQIGTTPDGIVMEINLREPLDTEK